LVTDFNGKPAAKEGDFPMAGQLGGVMGIGVAANGDVWLADGTKNNMLFFPGGRVKDGRIVKVDGLKSTFGVAIDKQNRVWSATHSRTQLSASRRTIPPRRRLSAVGSARTLALAP
jgi:hypothetical protein